MCVMLCSENASSAVKLELISEMVIIASVASVKDKIKESVVKVLNVSENTLSQPESEGSD